MTPDFCFSTANFVARQLNYKMTRGWGEGDAATNAWFSPLGTFAERFEAMLLEAKALGFKSIDLWAAHLHWRWATLHHVESAKMLFAKHGLTPRIYAAWVMGGATELEAACRFCAELRIPLIGGYIELAEKSRAAAAPILRRYGIAYGMENHPETSVAEYRARLGAGDEDVIGLCFDTGWCGTRGWDALAGLKELSSRIFAVHLKDVLPKRTEKTGLEMADMGHETCRLGSGIVPVREIVQTLRQLEFRGPMSIEHEPETYDPRDDIRAGRELAERWWNAVEVREPAPRLRVAVVGCGNIANAYGEALAGRPEIELLGAHDIDSTRAAAWTAKFGGRAYGSLDEALGDPAVEVVVNLTIQNAHVEVVTRALEAGKHVHSEKPLAPTFTEANRLVKLADARGLRLSCAPVTWLGEAQQTAWKAIRDDRIGTPRVVYATVDWARIETWHPNPVPFYAVGPVFDVAVYPLALLTAWFGPVRRVTAGGGIVLPERVTKDGKPFTVTTDNFIVALLTFENGIHARITANFYVGDPAEKRAGLEVHGDRGSLQTEWFAATAPVRVGKFGERYEPVRLIRPPTGQGEWYVDWSAGVYELWRALRFGGTHPTTGAHAAHVVEVMETVHRAVATGAALPVTSSFAPAKPLAWAT